MPSSCAPSRREHGVHASSPAAAAVPHCHVRGCGALAQPRWRRAPGGSRRPGRSRWLLAQLGRPGLGPRSHDAGRRSALGPRAAASVRGAAAAAGRSARPWTSRRCWRPSTSSSTAASSSPTTPRSGASDDYWASPLETLDKGRGDCEDYAIAKYFSLLAAGVPVARLRLVYVRAHDRRARAARCRRTWCWPTTRSPAPSR